MTFSPQSFLSNINAKEGLAKPSRFEVILPIPPYINQFVGNSVLEKIINLGNTLSASIANLLSRSNQSPQSTTANPTLSRYLALQCESAELPGKTLQAADVKIYGPTFKVPYQTQYGETTLTFLCTNDFYERKLFEKWMESIMPTDTNNLRYPKGSDTRYLTNIKIIQYDEFVKQIYAVEMIDAFPIGIAPQTLAWSEDGFHRLSVQFSYQKYKVIYDGNYNLSALAGELLGQSIGDRLQGVSTKINSISDPTRSILGRIVR